MEDTLDQGGWCAAPVSGWRAIDSAPKDGTRIIVVSAWGWVEVARWALDAWRDDYDRTTDLLTRWRPLPGWAAERTDPA